MILTGKRHEAPEVYRQVLSKLTTVGFVILRSCHIVIPSTLREQVLRLIHEGHQGITKCKERLRSRVWWPGVDKAMENICRTYHACQVTQSPSHPPPKQRSTLPLGRWIDIVADLLGPMPSGEHLLVVVDYYSRYFEVERLT